MAVYEAQELDIVVNGKVHKVRLPDASDIEEVKKVLESLGENAYQWKGMTTSKDQDLNNFYGKDYIGYWSDAFGIQNLPAGRAAGEWVLIKIWGTMTNATNVDFVQEVIYPKQQLHYIRDWDGVGWTVWKKYSLIETNQTGVYKTLGSDFSTYIPKVGVDGNTSNSNILLNDVVEQNNPNAVFPSALEYNQTTGWNVGQKLVSLVPLVNGYSPGIVGQGKLDANQLIVDNTIGLPILNKSRYRHLYSDTNKTPLDFSNIKFDTNGKYLYSNKDIKVELFDPYTINSDSSKDVAILFAISIDNFDTVNNTVILSFGGKCDNGWDRFAIRYIPTQKTISLLVMNKAGTSQIYNDNICEIDTSGKPTIIRLYYNNTSKEFGIHACNNNSTTLQFVGGSQVFEYEMDDLFELDEQRYFHLCPGLALWGIAEAYGDSIGNNHSNPFYFTASHENKMRTQYIPNAMVLSQITGEHIKTWNEGQKKLQLEELTVQKNNSIALKVNDHQINIFAIDQGDGKYANTFIKINKPDEIVDVDGGSFYFHDTNIYSTGSISSKNFDIKSGDKKSFSVEPGKMIIGYYDKNGVRTPNSTISWQINGKDSTSDEPTNVRFENGDNVIESASGRIDIYSSKVNIGSDANHGLNIGSTETKITSPKFRATTGNNEEIIVGTKSNTKIRSAEPNIKGKNNSITVGQEEIKICGDILLKDNATNCAYLLNDITDEEKSFLEGYLQNILIQLKRDIKSGGDIQLPTGLTPVVDSSGNLTFNFK